MDEKIEVIKCPQGHIFAACEVPHNLTDKQWKEDKEFYLQHRCTEEIIERDKFKFDTCNCKLPKPPSVSPIEDHRHIEIIPGVTATVSPDVSPETLEMLKHLATAAQERFGKPGERKPLYKIGDSVKIVKYGHLLWSQSAMKESATLVLYKKVDGIHWYDIAPDKIGKQGLITDVKITQGTPHYSISNIGAWYIEDQMELITVKA